MCRDVTVPAGLRLRLLLGGGLLAAGVAAAQPVIPAPTSLTPDWRRLGTYTYEAQLASLATGPVDRVWFSLDGARLFVHAASGRVFTTLDFEHWRPEPDTSPPGAPPSPPVVSLPEPGARVRAADTFNLRLYAFGRDVYRSDDAGKTWNNRSGWDGASIIGDGVADLAVSPLDPDAVVAVNDYGVWRSADGGLSWCGLNEGLPNLPLRRLLATPTGSRGTWAALSGGETLEWTPGEKESWRPLGGEIAGGQESFRYGAALQIGERITAAVEGAEYSYAGSDEGNLWVSRDRGRTWRLARLGAGGAVEAIAVPSGAPGQAVVALSEGDGDGPWPRVLRTMDGGTNWADISGDLPTGSAWGLAADAAGTAVYAACESGLYLSLDGAGALPLGAHWVLLSGNLPQVPVRDVRLDEGGYQVFAALDGYGLYAAPAPHRYWRVEVANAADFSNRPAAPGSLLTVLGGRLIRAQAGLLPAPVLFASDTQSQLQVPFEISGPSMQLALELSQGQVTLSVPVSEVSPAIFVDRDGAAMVMDGDTGLILDGAHPARSGARLQVLATGLGRVTPAWRTGAAAPYTEPPQVAVPVRAFLGGSPVEVTRATLAPGYIGFYLVEIRLPALVDAGASDLYVEAMGRQSNRVRIHLQP